jgi:VWFA-related protein
MVLVDVVVTDHGKPAHGIDRSSFHIFEDGHEQAIASFEEHQPHPVSPNAIKAAAQIAALPPHTYTNVSPYPAASAVNVLLLDALNTPMADQAELRKEMIEYLGKVPSGTPIAIFALASRLQLITGFTTDAAALAKAMKGKTASPSQSVMMEPQSTSTQMALEQEAAAMEDMGTPIFSIQSIEQFEADLTTFQTDQRVRMTIDAMDELARYLSAIPGRKNLIWFTGSFPVTLDPDSNQSSYRNTESYADNIREASNLLGATRVAVYPVDARGLMTSPTADASYVPSPNSMTVNNRGKASSHSPSSNIGSDNTKFMSQNAEEHGSMTLIAEETGGKAFFNSNDLKGAVADVMDSGSSYYTIAYVPPSAKLDGSFRRIKVTVNGGGDKLAYRDGYYAAPGYGPGSSERNSAGAKLITAAILHGAPPATQILMTARVLPSTDAQFKNVALPTDPAGQMAATIKGPPHLYVVDLDVDPRGIGFNDAAEGGHEARIQFLLVGYDAQGNRVNYQDQPLDITLKPRQFENIMGNGLHARMFLDLPAGSGFLRIAVQDMNAGRAGSLEVPLQAAK